eukprot:scaffold36942_cov50-Phaeocystis_antarctica.AAC.3
MRPARPRAPPGLRYGATRFSERCTAVTRKWLTEYFPSQPAVSQSLVSGDFEVEYRYMYAAARTTAYS